MRQRHHGHRRARHGPRSGGCAFPRTWPVMGFDDIEAASLVSPGLTTMANPAREIGQACARRLLERLAGRDWRSSRPRR
ncbi:substrate-binding domain-containing protein [Streptosporangium vulgare]|uniref:substrate-binding domain-containing protein n=1 Tax=Streptosporangium vulgare TaxID=46190 RepID=UPI003CD055A4